MGKDSKNSDGYGFRRWILGDTSTLADPSVVTDLVNGWKELLGK